MDDDRAVFKLELVKILKALLEKLQDELERGAESAKPVDLDQPIGRLSRMDAIQSQKMAQASRARTKIRIEQVKAALKRQDDEIFGLCFDCEEPIAEKRLRARPESTMCIECQTIYEASPKRR